MTTYVGSSGLINVASNPIAEIKGYSYEETSSTIEDSALTDTSSTHKAGRKSWSGSVECHWDPTDTTGQNAMVAGNSMEFVFMPNGNVAGQPTTTGTAVITNVATNVSDESIISQTYTLLGSGPLAYGTVSV